MRVPTSLLYNRNIQAITNNQRDLADIQESLSSGKRINKPSDDPVGAARVVRLTESIEKLDQYQTNNALLVSGLEQQETVLSNITDSGQRARVLAIRAGSGALTDRDREAIAEEVEQLRNEVFDLMNYQTANGEYIFSGFKSGVQAYSFNPSSTSPFTFLGDTGTSSMKLSDNVEVRSTVSGQQVFENALARYNFDSLGVNNVSGTASLNTFSIVEQGSFDSFFNQNYDTTTPANNEYQFSVIAGNQLEVTNAGTGAVVSTIPFTSGDKFTFAGIDFTFEGAVGDSFNIELREPEKKNLAETLNDLAIAMRDPTLSVAQISESVSDAIVGIDNSLADIANEISSIGGRVNAARSISNTNLDLDIVLKESRSEIEDTDFAEASAEFARQETALQAVFATFPRISNLSLFNFIN